MDSSDFKTILREIENITFSGHFYDEKVRLRGISENDVIGNLKEPRNLVAAEDQGEEARGHKYALLFHKSNKYDLKVVVSVKDKSLNVITAHIQSIKRRKVYIGWLKRLR